MSDSDAALPSDATISRKLRDVVIAIHKAGNTDDLTVKRVRSKAEEELGLASGFFKTNSEWKQKSHDTIHEAVDKYCGDNAPEPESPPPKKPTKAKQATKKEKAAKDSPRGIKRKPVAPAKKPQKRSRVVDSDDESEAEASRPAPKAATPSDTDSEPPAKPVRRNTKVVAQDSDLEVTPTKLTKERKEENDANSASRSTAHDDTTNDLSESELSSLIDEEPVKKKGQKRAQQAPRKEPKSKVPKSAKAKGKTASSKTDDDPDSAEIKRLQGWLVKCGIRKVWSKELAKCVTPKEKIKHLKGMLTDAGMGGKYSNEKAARIKEQREFAKDLEEIQQGELAWGKSREEDTGSRPRRRLAQPARRAIIEDEDDDDEDDQKKEKDESDVSDQGKNDDVMDVDSE